MDSFSLYRRDIANKTFDFIAEDILPRYVTVSTLIDADYGMLAGADKFGNLFVSKITNGNTLIMQASRINSTVLTGKYHKPLGWSANSRVL